MLMWACMSLNRSRYTFPIVLLDSCQELLLLMELEGNLVYNHGEWMAAQDLG